MARSRIKYKYSGKGGFSSKSFPQVDKGLANVLASSANASLSSSTWANYGTAYRHIKRCNEELGTNLRLPFRECDTYAYVSYLIKRHMTPDTIRGYMSAIRTQHLIRGLSAVNLKPILLENILSGEKKRRNQQLRLLPKLIHQARYF